LNARVTDSGGSVDLIFALPGAVYLGSTLGWRDMARRSDLHIDLGIEVFPEYN
jgi:hypothetical protein